MRSRPIALAIVITALGCNACNRDKQVPFGLPSTEEPADPAAEPNQGKTATDEPTTDEPGEPTATQFAPGQTELTLADKALVLQEGMLLASLPLDLDEDEQLEAIVISTADDTVTLHRATQSLSSLVLHRLSSLSVPPNCVDATATVSIVSDSLLKASVFHACDGGPRENHWILSREPTPRVYDRLTLLPGKSTDPPTTVAFEVDDKDGDSLPDLVVRFTIDANDVRLVWLDRPNGLSRDLREPEESFRQLASKAREALTAEPSDAERDARLVLTAFETICRESGVARLGTSGTHGVQCGRSRSVGLAAGVLAQALIAQGRYVEALDASGWLTRDGVEADSTLQKSLDAAWQGARGPASLAWKTLASESGTAEMSFRDNATLVIRGASPRTVDLATGSATPVERKSVGAYAVHDRSNRFGVKRVNGNRCQKTRALISAQPYETPLSWSVFIDSPKRTDQRGCCKNGTCGNERSWWRVVGWAPQGLITAREARIRVVPLNKQLRAIGGWQDATATQPLPAPIFGAAITRDGSSHAIKTAHGFVVHRRQGGTSVWVRPTGAGPVRGFAIAPNGRALAVHQGDEIRLAQWP